MFDEKKNKQAGKSGGKGFSLIEMIIAMSIFIIVISVVAMVFSSNSSYQKRILASQEVQTNTRYIMEVMSRELRTMKEVNNNQSSTSLNDTDLSFKNYRDENIIYCLSDAAGVCDAAGEFVARISPNGPQVINTSTVRIKNLRFLTNDFSVLPYRQKIITIFFTAESLVNPDIKLDVQTSTTTRLF